ncbi:hypothetical protein NHX12_001091 [Muraenolepis orangiensis]|uniref:Lysophospholipid acyltransferase 1 n=1 Tax=Muraenolepis orangiensis TaxID=630683 RepID=A0A9Q0IGY2_9TELE|nr:hypothetical protein NHX12_001091 [Muraenolepis orangiensis]
MGDRVDAAFMTTGSKWLLPISEFFGFPLDQVFALGAAFWFRLYLGPLHAGPLVRHAVATLFGMAFVIFCFGWYSVHIVILVLLSYTVLITADIGNVHRYSMLLSMGYLTVCQISRVFIFNYGILSTDFSGPLMIVTQKITTLAFQLHDGIGRKPEELTLDQLRLAINRRPSLAEYLSYNLNFLSVLVGPCSNYQDYVDFIDGRHIQRRLRKQAEDEGNGHANGYDKTPDISPLNAVCSKLLVCGGCMLFFLTVTRSLPIARNVDPDFTGHAPFLTRLAYAFFSIQAARPKFYFAWTLADAINNAAGYGFMGMDSNGKPSWDLICNLNIWKIETATSFKTFIDNWNIQTGVWLKSVCYDRAPRHRMALTFVLSALWHGVYPGYYFTFITAIPITAAARALRRCVRHYFLCSRGVKLLYDIMTWAATQLAICYTVMPFLLLAVEPTMVYYRSMFFHVHLISMLVAFVLHSKHTPASKPPPSAPSSSSPFPLSTCPSQCQGTHSNNNVKAE